MTKEKTKTSTLNSRSGEELMESVQ